MRPVISSFFVTNAIHGSSSSTNVLAGVFTNIAVISNTVAVFVPTNTTPVFTGYASFDAYVTNNDTVAYFGPVTVSVVVSPGSVVLNSNIPPVIRPLRAGFARSLDIPGRAGFSCRDQLRRLGLLRVHGHQPGHLGSGRGPVLSHQRHRPGGFCGQLRQHAAAAVALRL